MATELKTLLLSWKLERLYETLIDEEIFIEELEMMTMEHVEKLLKNHKMGIRIRFEYNFKKWRNSIGQPLDGIGGFNTQCIICEQQKNSQVKTDITNLKTIEKKQQSIQKDHNLETAPTQTMAESNDSSKSQVIKIIHSPSQMRQVLDRIDKYKTSDTIKAARELNLATITQTKVPITQPNNLDIEQQTSTIRATTNSMQTNNFNQSLLQSSSDESSTSSALQKTQFVVPKTSLTVSPAKQTEHPVVPKISLDFIESVQRKPYVRKSTSKSNNQKNLKRPSSDMELPSTSATALKKLTPDNITPTNSPNSSLQTSSTVQIAPNSPGAYNTAHFSFIFYYTNRNLEKCKEQLKLTGRSVLNILFETYREGHRILKHYQENQLITSLQRELIIEIICDYYWKNNIPLSLETSYNLEEQILELFPSEKIEYYRTDKYGLIFRKFFTMQKSMALTKKHRQKQQNTNESMPVEDSDSDNSINILNPNNMSNQLNTNLEEIKMEYISD